MARSVTDIQADLDAAYLARRTAFQAQSYSLDTGQGRHSVTRVDLKALSQEIKNLEAELAGATDAANGYTGFDHVSLQRNCQ